MLRYYLGAGPALRDDARARWPTTQVFDWRDAVDRLRRTRPRPTLDRLLASVPPGSEFVVVTPVFRDYRAWQRDVDAARLAEVAGLDVALLQADPRLRLVRHVATNEIALKRNYFKPLQAFVYRRVG